MSVVVLVLSMLIMAVGLVGSVVPVLPGPPLVFVGILIYALYTRFEVITGLHIWLFLFLTLLSFVIDYASGAVGARWAKSSGWGVLGALIGGIVGLFFLPWGVLIGPLAGAILLEALARREFRKSFRAGAGAVLGVLGGSICKVVISVAMILIFVHIVF
jgi:uncharacterized protein YqgC (DUF456 family)